MFIDEFETLDKHPAAAACRIKNPTFVGFEQPTSSLTILPAMKNYPAPKPSAMAKRPM